ncbi:unnamed protein product [Brassica oleracea]
MFKLGFDETLFKYHIQISIQAFNDEDTQGHRTIGLFLHHREAEITDSIRTKHDDPFQRGSQSSKEGSIQVTVFKYYISISGKLARKKKTSLI